ncbi:hypothetical protein HYN46_14080 [Aquirhabdus parva]|uniref:Uncharacterized protein n=2 Tax=Aquirhabdus parva TaxID=2283318 RepID=A0A345P9A7_9GAMM|nr:hypothetical protein HYN46_14080 [Aquirhabdus parva]
MLGLQVALNRINSCFDEYGDCYLDKGHYGPGFIAALTAVLFERRVDERSFDTHSEVMSYLRTLGLHRVLWGNDVGAFQRVNEGRNYSPITALHNAEQVDNATTTINNCIRNFVRNRQSQGISELTKVVGELHDNVWSHGKSTGFSMAQKWAVTGTNRGDYYLEFALADRGFGFLEEMKRSRKNYASTDQEAIEWCIVEGHSTKHADDEDEWFQRLPEDFTGVSPMGRVGVVTSENHHQGLGLANLVSLVQRYDGVLHIASGNSLFTMRNNTKEFSAVKTPWKGVTISCRFKESSLLRQIEKDVIDAETAAIMSRLRGG